MAGPRVPGWVPLLPMQGFRACIAALKVGQELPQLWQDHMKEQTAPAEEEAGPGTVEHREELIADAMMANLRYAKATLVDLRDGLNAGWLAQPQLRPCGRAPFLNGAPRQARQ